MTQLKQQNLDWLQDWQVQSNDRTDRLTVYAASLHTMYPDRANPILTLISNLRLIQRRLAAVIKLMPPRQLRTEASI